MSTARRQQTESFAGMAAASGPLSKTLYDEAVAAHACEIEPVLRELVARADAEDPNGDPGSGRAGPFDEGRGDRPLSADLLMRLHAVFFPEQAASAEWYRELSGYLQARRIALPDVVAHLHRIGLRAHGITAGDRFLEQSLSIPEREVDGGRLTLAVRIAGTDTWLRHLIEFYRASGLQVLYAVDNAAPKRLRSLLSATGASFVEIEGQSPDVRSVASEVFGATDAQWILLLEGDELPTPGLIDFAVSVAALPENFAWACPRAHLRFDPGRNELQYSQFCLRFSATAAAGVPDAQWRLVSRDGPARSGPDRSLPNAFRAARPDAFILRFHWVVRSFAERLASAHPPTGGDADAALYHALYEAVPETWHLFSPLAAARYRLFASAAYHAQPAGAPAETSTWSKSRSG